MKKKLEAELISIAHRILKLKNKSELVQLHQESQKLYEKLSVLLFVEENFAGLQPTIGKSEAYEVLEKTAFGDSQEEVSQETKVSLDTQEEVASVAEKIVTKGKENHTEEIKEEEAVEESESENEEIAEAESEEETKSEEVTEEIVSEEDNSEEKVVVGQIELSDEDLDEEEPTVFETEEPTLEEAEEAVDQEVEPKVEEIASMETEETKKEEDDFMPTFELAFDKKEEETVEEVAKESGHQIIFEDFLGDHYKDLEFVKAEIEKKHEHDEEENRAEVKPEEEVKAQEPVQEEAPKQEEKTEAPKEEPKPHVEKVTKGITIGLNDRVGFVNHLFGGSNEDFNRVLSQLNTFDTFQDAKNFIEDLVKPDYNEWKGKEDFEERFLEVVENKFK